MIKLLSDWKMATDENGKAFQMLILFMSKDNEDPFNVAIHMNECMGDADLMMTTIITGVTELINACFPELKDPLYRMKKELKELESRVAFVKRNIHEIETARAEPEFDEV